MARRVSGREPARAEPASPRPVFLPDGENSLRGTREMSASALIDRTLVPAADFEFVILADTHYMEETDEGVEFESRRRQAARSAHALALVDAIDPAFVVHMGDLVQAFPGTDHFETALDAADRQLRRIDADVRHVAGNHDVGDKPDPTMPTNPVTPASLDAYHDRFGRSWYSWDHGGVHFAVLNSQLLNSSLPAARDQQTWLEADLHAASDGPVFVFLHLPLFLHQPDEPALGHYDNVGQPARDWLLELLRKHSVARVFSAHSHFSFQNRVGQTRLRVVPSPSFTRPGFGELFSSCPPPERGRDDRGKLGFYLVRVVDTEAHLHFIRTNGRTDPTPDEGRVLTRSTPALPDAEFGASLVQPIADATHVPATFPSSIEQAVANDYPALACVEAGIACIRTPVCGLDDAPNRDRLDGLRADGVTVVGTALAGPGQDTDTVGQVEKWLDEVELRLPDGVQPADDVVRRIRAYQQAGLPVGLSTVRPQRSIAGKQHDRLRGAYEPREIAALDAHLEESGIEIDRAVRWIGTDVDPWDVAAGEPASESRSCIGNVDWLVPTTDVDEDEVIDRLARAAFASALRPGSRLYVEPLRALDRTMDPAPGLLDRLCNPTAAFHAVRCLNTVLSAEGRAWRRGPELSVEGAEFLSLESHDAAVGLVLPTRTEAPVSVDDPPEWRSHDRRLTISLPDGTTRRKARSDDARDRHRIADPTLLVFATSG